MVLVPIGAAQLGAVHGVGTAVAEGVQSIAGLLTQPWAPGLVVILMAVALIVATLWFLRWAGACHAALRRVRQIVEEAPDAAAFRRGLEEAGARIEGLRARGGPWAAVATGWDDFKGTLIRDPARPTEGAQGALRPALYFNTIDLGFGAAGWRLLPGLFVSVGLLLTFLGLIAALQNVGEALSLDADNRVNGLRDLVRTASAKFIMSLSGLAASILFTVVLRFGLARIEDGLHRLCGAIERRLDHASLEDLALKQLASLNSLKSHQELLHTRLVADLGEKFTAPLGQINEALRVTLPQAIGESIGRSLETQLQPVLDKFRAEGTSGIGDMAQALSQQVSTTLGTALTGAAEQMRAAGDLLGQVAGRLDLSGDRAAGAMEASIGRLAEAVAGMRQGLAQSAAETGQAFTAGAQTLLAEMNTALAGIRDNTGASLAALDQGARGMAEAGAAFRADIGAAAAGMRDGLAQSAAQTGQAFTTGAQTLLAEMNAALAAIRENTGASQAALEEAAWAMSEAATGFRTQMGAAAEEARTAATQSMAVAADEGADAVRAGGAAVVGAFEQVAQALAQATDRADAGAQAMARFADATTQGAAATGRAAQGIADSERGLAAAQAGSAAALDRLDRSIGGTLAASRTAAEAVGASTTRIAEQARVTLEAARTAIGGERAAIEQVLAAMDRRLAEFVGMSERFDGIDQGLGAALAQIVKGSNDVIGEVVRQATEVHREYERALAKLAETVEALRDTDFTPGGGTR